MTDQEEWRDVPGYEGYYMASTEGRIKSLYGGKERIMRLKPGRNGYPHVTLCKDGKHRDLTVHVIIARTFLGECPEGYEVNHEGASGDKTDNRVSNLSYVTHIENSRHAVDVLGRQRGETHGGSKLTERQVLEIKQLYSSGISSPVLAKRFGVKRGQIHAIVTGRSWKHLPQSAPTDGDNQS